MVLHISLENFPKSPFAKSINLAEQYCSHLNSTRTNGGVLTSWKDKIVNKLSIGWKLCLIVPVIDILFSFTKSRTEDASPNNKMQRTSFCKYIDWNCFYSICVPLCGFLGNIWRWKRGISRQEMTEIISGWTQSFYLKPH